MRSAGRWATRPACSRPPTPHLEQFLTKHHRLRGLEGTRSARHFPIRCADKESTMNRHSFLDDYSEGAHPAILKALSATNMVQQTAYGDDAYSQEARDLIRRHMGDVNPDVWFVASGTLA